MKNMLNQEEINKIKNTAEEFFKKMTVEVSKIDASSSTDASAIELDLKLEEPQILIGQQGQTLFEIQRLLKMVLNKKLQKNLYLNLDINDYKKKKTEYLKDLAKSLADQVSLSKEERAFLPMPAYERKIIHSELSQRSDILAGSVGEGVNRHIVIRPKS